MALTPASSSGSSSSSSLAFAVIADQKANGTNGGTPAAAGAFNTRTLNTEVSDLSNIVSIAANQFTLQAGTYVIEASAPCYAGDRHQLRLRNITDTTTDALGTSEFAFSGGSSHQTRAFLFGIIVIGAAKVYELQHYVQAAQATLGFGVATNSGDVEVYAVVSITKIA